MRITSDPTQTDSGPTFPSLECLVAVDHAGEMDIGDEADDDIDV